MKFARKIISWILKSLVGIISLIILYLISAIILTLIPVNSNFKESKEGTAVFVNTNGVHVNLIIPSQSNLYNWTNQFNSDNSYKYLAFGWGDEEFYMNIPTWADFKISTALKAAFIPTSSLIQVYGLKKSPLISKNTRKLHLSDEQLKILSDYIYESFRLDSTSNPIELFPETTQYSFYKYYEAKGKYSLFFTCNNWASKGLKKVGVKNGVWTPFDKSVLYHLKRP